MADCNLDRKGSNHQRGSRVSSLTLRMDQGSRQAFWKAYFVGILACIEDIPKPTKAYKSPPLILSLANVGYPTLALSELYRVIPVWDRCPAAVLSQRSGGATR